jgi:excisionase family DNA binding protein
MGLAAPADAGEDGHLAAPLLPRGLSVKAAAAYVGVSVRDLWRRVERDELPVVRWPGCRRVVFDRQDLDALFSSAFKGPR